MIANLKVLATSAGSVLLSVIISFFPKCPFCWAAYMSLFSSVGLASVPYMPWLKPVMIGFFAVNFFTLFMIARKRNNFASFGLSMTGAMLIMISTFLTAPRILIYTGLLLIIASSLWNLFARKLACKVSQRVVGRSDSLI